ncbi:MAG: hypothetical protein E7653_01610 [Ruminococcaceae bacterium]|nr:hypothetical protein [Oscillospiraceae bacterium]
MTAFLITAFLGLLLIVIGIINMTGNISSLHWYHRQRVAKEDIKPLGKRVGIGTILCGAAIIFFGAMSLIYELTSLMPLMWIGSTVMLICIAIGIFITLKAIIKYNKGLF